MNRIDNASINRMNRGQKIAEEKTICENGDGSFSVPSATVEKVAYLVRLIDGKYVCNCLDFKYKEMRAIEACKHVHAVKFWIASQVELQEKPKPKVFADDAVQCPKCASIRVVKTGHSNGKQTFGCKDCDHRFRELSLLKKAQYTPETVSLCLDLYFSGMSLRKISRTISDQFDMDIGHTTILSWIQRYIPKISEYVNSLAPTELSDTWHTDEVFQHMKGGNLVKSNKRVAYLWQVMDRKTQFLLASQLSRFRDEDGACHAFNTALENAHGFKPQHVLTDSAKAYKYSVNRLFGQGVHIAKCGVGNKPAGSNNRIERANGTTRERLKVQRGWKSMNTQIPEGMRIQYNFVKPHQALEGMTPAQRAGIGTDSKSKWLELLESSIKAKSQ